MGEYLHQIKKRAPSPFWWKRTNLGGAGLMTPISEMRLGEIFKSAREVAFPGGAERDAGFRLEIQRLSRRGLPPLKKRVQRKLPLRPRLQRNAAGPASRSWPSG